MELTLESNIPSLDIMPVAYGTNRIDFLEPIILTIPGIHYNPDEHVFDLKGCENEDEVRIRMSIFFEQLRRQCYKVLWEEDIFHGCSLSIHNEFDPFHYSTFGLLEFRRDIMVDTVDGNCMPLSDVPNMREGFYTVKFLMKGMLRSSDIKRHPFDFYITCEIVKISLL